MESTHGPVFDPDQLKSSFHTEFDKATKPGGGRLYLAGGKFKALSWIGFIVELLRTGGQTVHLSQRTIEQFYERVEVDVDKPPADKFAAAASARPWLPSVFTKRGVPQVRTAMDALRTNAGIRLSPVPGAGKVRKERVKALANGIKAYVSPTHSQPQKPSSALSFKRVDSWRQLAKNARTSFEEGFTLENNGNFGALATSFEMLLPPVAERQFGPDGSFFNCHDALDVLRDGLSALALQRPLSTRALEQCRREIKKQLMWLGENPAADAQAAAGHIEKALAKASGSHFKPAFDRIRGARAPQKMSSQFKIEGQLYTERTENIGHGLAADFLTLVDPLKYGKRIDYLRERGGGIRVSEDKKAYAAQATTVNHCWHTVEKSPSGEEVGRLLRHGAIAIHGNKGINSADREDLLLAQALPVIAASLSELAMDPIRLRRAAQAGSFLHEYQMLVSPGDSDEMKMLKDSEKAMRLISERVMVEVSEDNAAPSITRREDGKFILHLPAAEGITLAPMPVQGVLHCQGVNVEQAVSELIRGGDAYQTEINRQGHQKLVEYFRASGAQNEFAVMQYIEAWQDPDTNEMDLLTLRRRAVQAAGGGYSEGCKSNKERGACLASRELAIDIAFSQAKGIADYTHLAYAAQQELLGGLSHVRTQTNVGVKRGYALNDLQRTVIDARSKGGRWLDTFAPPSHLSAKGGAPT